MQQRDFVVALLFAVVVLTGCNRSVETPTAPPVSQTSMQPTTEQPVLQESEPIIASTEGQDFLQQLAAMNSPGSPHESEFRSGHVAPITTSSVEVNKNERGFTIQLPSNSPIPTPTVFQGRLYLSGGFSSEEYYCSDARTGAEIWGVELDDDGPSSAVPYRDSIDFGCESCTIFALAAETDEMKWSHWLGDPLLSMPTLADGRVFKAFPEPWVSSPSNWRRHEVAARRATCPYVGLDDSRRPLVALATCLAVV